MPYRRLDYRLNGNFIRELLDRNHRTQNWLAEEINVCRQHLSLLLDQKKPVSPRVRRALLQVELLAGRAESELWTIRPVGAARGADADASAAGASP